MPAGLKLPDASKASGVTAQRLSTDVPWHRSPRPLLGISAISAGVLIAVAATWAGVALSRWLPQQSVALVYLLAVVLAAIGPGVRTGITVAILSGLAYNYFFIPPIYTFSIADPRELFAFLVFLAVALATGSVAGRLREVADISRRREAALRLLNEFAASLSAAREAPVILQALARQASETIRGEAVIMSSEGDLVLFATVPGQFAISTADWQAARRALRSREPVYPPADGWSGARLEFHPIMSGDVPVGVIGLAPPDGRRGLFTDERESVDTLLRHAGIALERARLEIEAVRMRGESERERLRSALLSSLSHDLRTPLASIVGSATSLRELGDKLTPDTRSDLLMTIEEEAERLSRFVTNLLHMTRLETGDIDLARDWIDVGDVVRSALSRAHRLKPNAIVDFNCPGSLPAVRGDAVLLDHVIFNLLENSLKFSPGCASIAVDVDVAPKGIVIMVTDRGRGIPPDVRARLFQPFNRVKASDEDVRGTGLGLAISKRIVEGMGGTIEVESPVADGRGTRVTVRVPVPPPLERQCGDAPGEAG